MRRLERSWVLGAFGFLPLLAVGSCASIHGIEFSSVPCAASDAAQKNVRPCDIYDAARTPCAAAFSTTRALYSAYAGPLYQVTRASDATQLSIGVLSDGYADAAAQDGFCANTTCTITRIFDQSANHNDLTVAPPGGAAIGPGPLGEDLPAIADSLPIAAGGHKVYGVSTSAGMGYRNDATTGIAVNGEAEGVYMVSSGTHIGTGCCFDFGNAETNRDGNGPGHMDAISVFCQSFCLPQVGIDMENGIYPQYFPFGEGLPFVTAMGANDGQHNYAVYWGNAQSGCLTTTGSLALPPNGYAPMHQEGAIILGIGGDNSNHNMGSFFEGAMTMGAPTSATMAAVQANVVRVGYGAGVQ
jgi:hypothetical protein